MNSNPSKAVQCGDRVPSRSSVPAFIEAAHRAFCAAFIEGHLEPSKGNKMHLSWLKVCAERLFADWDWGGIGTRSVWVSEATLRASLEAAGYRVRTSKADGRTYVYAKRLKAAPINPQACEHESGSESAPLTPVTIGSS